MKKYEVVWTELSDGSFRCDANNDGFSGMEILSLLELKRDDVKAQLYNDTKFTRTILDMNGIREEIANKT